MNTNEINNIINQQQWTTILNAFNYHCTSNEVPTDMPHIGEKVSGQGSVPKRSQFIYDNYDSFSSPGLLLVSLPDADEGKLFVYNSSEQAHAPITFDQGLKIANNFFNYTGYMMSEKIVCDYLMSGF